MIINKYILLLLAAVIVSSFSQILLKKSAKKKYSSLIREYVNPYVVCGYMLMVMSTIMIIVAYRGVEYKNGPLIESLGYLLVFILSYIFFKEPITKKKVFGNLMVLLGIAIFYM